MSSEISRVKTKRFLNVSPTSSLPLSVRRRRPHTFNMSIPYIIYINNLLTGSKDARVSEAVLSTPTVRKAIEENPERPVDTMVIVEELIIDEMEYVENILYLSKEDPLVVKLMKIAKET